MSVDMEKTQDRIKNAVNSLMDELDKNYLRNIQKIMFKCSAQCCEDKMLSREIVEKCIDNCNLPIKKAQSLIEGELGTLQSQLSRCSMTCYDKQVQKYGPDPDKYNKTDLSNFTKNLSDCVDKCATDHIQLLPQIKERFIKSLLM